MKPTWNDFHRWVWFPISLWGIFELSQGELKGLGAFAIAYGWVVLASQIP